MASFVSHLRAAQSGGRWAMGDGRWASGGWRMAMAAAVAVLAMAMVALAVQKDRGGDQAGGMRKAAVNSRSPLEESGSAQQPHKFDESQHAHHSNHS